MKKYIGVIIIDAILGAIFAGIYMSVYLSLKNSIQMGYDTLGYIGAILIPLLFILIAGIIHGIATYVHYRNFTVPFLIITLTFVVANVAMLLFAVLTNAPVFDSGIYGVIFTFGISVGASSVSALITKLILHLAGKRKANSQPTTDIIE